MNERIRQLAEQATSIQGPTPYNPLTFEVFDKEKFAKLIIDDVMNEVFVVYPGGKHGSDVKYQNITARQWINQVFGVER
jgi:hypothetical protein